MTIDLKEVPIGDYESYETAYESDTYGGALASKLCDETFFTNFVATGIAESAIGSPTLEQLRLSSGIRKFGLW